MPRRKKDDSGHAEQWDSLAFKVAQAYVANRTPLAVLVSDFANAKILTPDGTRVTRQMVTPLLSRAIEQGFLRFVPPVNTVLEVELLKAFPQIGTRNSIHVASVDDRLLSSQVAALAAERALELIVMISRQRGAQSGQPQGGARNAGAVRLGLGPGRGTLEFCEKLALILAAHPERPLIELVAITSACPADHAELTPVSFFNAFRGCNVKSRNALFAETQVPAKGFAEHLKQIAKRSWNSSVTEFRDSIDIIVTGMGSFDDEHDLCRQLLKQTQEVPNDWVGNFQFRPYTETGPVPSKEEKLRAATLFELEDFQKIAGQKDRHVLLIARRCAQCDNHRVAGLLPLLQVSSLKVYSEIFIDAGVASALIHEQNARSNRQGLEAGA